jgi:DNA-binding transcriptional MerR regulator
MSKSESQDWYDIRAVTRLTGMTAPGLRMWEKRHAVVCPARTDTGRRRYSHGDVERIALLKSLVDAGHSIGSIAALATPQLRARLEEQSEVDFARGDVFGGHLPRTIVTIGPEMGELVRRDAASFPGVRLVAAHANCGEAMRRLEPGAADLLIIGIATLFPETVSEIDRLIRLARAKCVIVVYRFAQSAAEESVHRGLSGGAVALKGPVNAEELHLAWRIASGGGMGPAERAVPRGELGDQIPGRQFSDDQLARVAGLASVVECECPQHLANLLVSLNAFEEYSEQCENRDPSDAELHAYLHRAAAQARSLIEEALQKVIVTEQIATD